MSRLSRTIGLLLVVWCAASGCALFHPPVAVNDPLPNPIVVSIQDSNYVFHQAVDVIDDYFEIDREEGVKQVDDLITEGQITTHPRSGATFIEPWRGDSATPYERLHSTLQSTRRTAFVRVIPTAGGHQVEVQVAKELEDVARPNFATASAATLRHDGSIERYTDPVAGGRPNAGWIPLGRDVALEQRLLCDLQNRLSNPAVPIGGK